MKVFGVTEAVCLQAEKRVDIKKCTKYVSSNKNEYFKDLTLLLEIMYIMILMEEDSWVLLVGHERISGKSVFVLQLFIFGTAFWDKRYALNTCPITVKIILTQNYN